MRCGASIYEAEMEASAEEHARVPTARELSGTSQAPRPPSHPTPPAEPRAKTVVTLDLANPASALPPYLSHLPATDVLKVWPDRYRPDVDNPAWAHAFDWRDTQGYKLGCHSDCGYEPFAFNYAFNQLAHSVPSAANGTQLSFECNSLKDLAAKKRHFYTAFAYIKQYPTNARFPAVLDIDRGQFYSKVVPTIFSMANDINFLDRKVRLWDCNHSEHFLERVTSSVDGFPLVVCRSSNKFVQALCYSGKYKESVLKGEMAMAVAAGFPLDWSGLHVGTMHDITMWRKVQRSLFDWEYWIGDKGYIGAPEIICEYKMYKGRPLTTEQIEFNRMLQFYRGRNEHLVAELVQANAALNTRWRGSFALLAAIARLSMHMTGLQERMRGPRYPCYGPWPMHPELQLQYCSKVVIHKCMRDFSERVASSLWESVERNPYLCARDFTSFLALEPWSGVGSVQLW